MNWTDTEVSDESLDQILRAVRTVRNNLFHGDKATSMGEKEDRTLAPDWLRRAIVAGRYRFVEADLDFPKKV